MLLSKKQDMCANTQALLLHINTGSFVQLLLIYLSNDQKAQENDLQKQIFTAYRVTVLKYIVTSRAPLLARKSPNLDTFSGSLFHTPSLKAI